MHNQVALVTGAASGIGAAVARALAARGAAVAAVDRNEVMLREVVTKLVADGHRARVFAADVSDAAAVERTVTAVERRLGPVDLLVNAAGVLHLGQARELTDQQWAATFAVNTTGVFLMSRAVVNRMVSRCRGAIVTVASNAAGTARMDMAAYAASKAAAAAFTRCLGLEVARYGIRCNIVAPGSTDTPMLTALWQNGGGPEATLQGSLDAYRVGIPLGKLARPEDVAQAVLFLLSEQAGHITMHAMTVDGGATLGV
ncbi:MAG TPA: 2,3-dihydro-2,3-dihydroxybenzoate dehydrogenase [Micromonosporaceae bacterium]|nr:2,3-dihydro-2,3-dihydroxybenzoate dehydrogenase [Micromonosporaceae bacterium]